MTGAEQLVETSGSASPPLKSASRPGFDHHP
jgi:hypothetical protein